MPAPTGDPGDRDPATVAPGDAYTAGARVWLYRPGGWRPGVVLDSSPAAALVSYRPTAHRATSVDTVTPDRLVPRVEQDWLDAPGGP